MGAPRLASSAGRIGATRPQRDTNRDRYGAAVRVATEEVVAGVVVGVVASRAPAPAWCGRRGLVTAGLAATPTAAGGVEEAAGGGSEEAAGWLLWPPLSASATPAISRAPNASVIKNGA